MPNSNGHGGRRAGSGRKTKADELKLIERLTPLDDLANEELQKGIEMGDFRYLRLFFEYRYGKPTQRMEVESDSLLPAFKGFDFLPDPNK